MQNTHRARLLGSIYCLLPMLLLLDLQSPLGLAVELLYIVPLLGTRWLPGGWHLLTVATVSTVFTFLAPCFSPPAAPLWVDLTNRLLVIAMLWTMVLLLHWHRQVEEARQRLARQLLMVQENERRHLARELYDEVMQTLSALKLRLAVVVQTATTAPQPLEESMALVDALVEHIRSLSLDLRPSMLDDWGLGATLQWYCECQARHLALPIKFVAAALSSRPSLEREITCFRVVQEAVTNVAKHAQATQVWVKLQQQAGMMSLSIQDNGVGFDVAAVRRRMARGSVIGLRSLAERLRLVGGHLDMVSAPGAGATIHARVPLNEG
jgi:two-component system sensor histidine kinase UhpB